MAIEGDIVIPWEKEISIQTHDGIFVNAVNINKINKRIQKYLCAPTGAIIGYKGVLAAGELGAIEKAVQKEEHLQDGFFSLSHMPQ